MTTISFTCLGEPVTKGSVVAFVPKLADGSYARLPNGAPRVVKHDQSYGKSGRGRSHAAMLAYSAHEARMKAGLPQLREAQLEVHLRFYVPRPKSHYGTGRNSQVLKDSAPVRPAKRPDIDKFIRHVLDSLRGAVYMDDSQVVSLSADKFYDDLPRTEVDVVVLTQQTVGVIRPSGQLSLAA